MDDQKLLNIVNKLLTASRKFKIEWATGKTTESFKCSLGNSTIFIVNVREQFYLLINNEAGNEIGRLSGYSYEYDLKELFELAKRKALKIDETLDNLDNLLDELN